MLAVKNNTDSYRARIEERQITHNVEADTRKSERRNRLSIILCVALAVSALWFVSAKGAEIYSLSYANVKLQTQIQKMTASNASLTAQVDELERPSRILNIALGKLHMQYANPVRIGGSVSGK